MKKAIEVLLGQSKKYLMKLEALRRHKGFRSDTDTAFVQFWKREGDSLKKREFLQVSEEGETISSHFLSDTITEPDDNIFVLNAYCYSQEAQDLCKKYQLLYPYHYNQIAHPSLSPVMTSILSAIHATGSIRIIDGEEVWMFQHPSIQGFRDKVVTQLIIKIDLSWPKEEIMKIFEVELDNAFEEKERIGGTTKKRGVALDFQPFKIWDMNKLEGKSPWKITKELHPGLKQLTVDKCNMVNCIEKQIFNDLNEKEKDKYASKDCGKKESCLKARSYLENVKDAIAKAEKQIASISPLP